jgi:NADPH2:quinone reductase
MAREGVHPETPAVPFTPGWDLVGVVDRLGDGISGIEPGSIVPDADPRRHAEFVCLPQRELTPVPPGLDVVEAVSPLNYITAYQMLHRSAHVRRASALIHGAAGGVGTALCLGARRAGWRNLFIARALAVSELGVSHLMASGLRERNFRLTSEA